MSTADKIARRSNWPWLSLIPLGLGAWAPIYAGVRARVKSWVLLGIMWSAIVVAGFVANAVSKSGQSGNNDFAGFLLILGWLGAIATSFSIRGATPPSSPTRGACGRRMGPRRRQAAQAGEQRLEARRRALELARRDPAL